MMSDVPFFEPPHPDLSPLVGLTVDLARACGPCQCGSSLATICPGKGKASGQLRCANSECSRHRDWLGRCTAIWILTEIEKFGRPTVPVDIHNGRQMGTSSAAARAQPKEDDMPNRAKE
jgi:hypothetical protein